MVDNDKASQRSCDDIESVILVGIYETLSACPLRFQLQRKDVSICSMKNFKIMYKKWKH